MMISGLIQFIGVAHTPKPQPRPKGNLESQIILGAWPTWPTWLVYRLAKPLLQPCFNTFVKQPFVSSRVARVVATNPVENPSTRVTIPPVPVLLHVQLIRSPTMKGNLLQITCQLYIYIYIYLCVGFCLRAPFSGGLQREVKKNTTIFGVPYFEIPTCPWIQCETICGLCALCSVHLPGVDAASQLKVTDLFHFMLHCSWQVSCIGSVHFYQGVGKNTVLCYHPKGCEVWVSSSSRGNWSSLRLLYLRIRFLFQVLEL